MYIRPVVVGTLCGRVRGGMVAPGGHIAGGSFGALPGLKVGSE